MAAYDLSSGFAGLNQGLKGLGDALQNSYQRQYLQAVGSRMAAGDYDGAASLAYGHGDLATAQGIQQFQRQKQANDLLGSGLGGLLGGGAQGAAPIGAGLSASGAAPAMPAPSAAIAPQAADAGTPSIVQTPTGALNLDAAKLAIKGNESDGAGGYSAVGPAQPNGDRAYGAYQVMGKNIPAWTEEVLGQALTPAQFLASPQAQDRVFEAVFGGYAQKYGHAGAANAWFTGSPDPGPNTQDSLGTTPSDYVSGFLRKYVAAGRQLAAGADGPAIVQAGAAATAQLPLAQAAAAQQARSPLLVPGEYDAGQAEAFRKAMPGDLSEQDFGEDDRTGELDWSDAAPAVLAAARQQAARFGYAEDPSNPGHFLPGSLATVPSGAPASVSDGSPSQQAAIARLPPVAARSVATTIATTPPGSPDRLNQLLRLQVLAGIAGNQGASDTLKTLIDIEKSRVTPTDTMKSYALQIRQEQAQQLRDLAAGRAPRPLTPYADFISN